MTREDAISIMNVIVHMLEEKYDTDRVEDAVDMAIKALKQEPCEDAISRQAVLDLAEWFDLNKQHFTVANLIDEVENIPSVIPKHKMGHWIEHEHKGISHMECSECSVCFLRAYLTRNSYCPNCGARMVWHRKARTE